MSIPIPQPGHNLTVIRVQRPESPHPEDPSPESSALLPASSGQIIVRGPAVLVRKTFDKLGGVLESVATKGARVMKLGPECAAEEVVSFLSGESCVRKLDELYHWQQSSKTTSEPHHANPKPPDSVKKLQKLCKKLAGYTHGHPPETQLLAFKRIVMLTTRFIGLRCMFADPLASKMRVTSLDQSSLSRLWRASASHGGLEWDFFLKFAAYCITASDRITSAVEECPPSHCGRFHTVECVSENLIRSISSTDATELSRLAAIRYLAGIFGLHTFWSQRIDKSPQPQEDFICARHPPEITSVYQDPYSLVNGICRVSVVLLQDLSMDAKDRVTSDTLIPSDTEGIRLLLDAYWQHLPRTLQTFVDDDERSKESLRRVAELSNLLQGERSKCLFPDASTAARHVLESILEDGSRNQRGRDTSGSRHLGSVYSVAFSPDGRKIVSGSEDKTVRVWNAVTGQAALPPLQGHEDPVFSVAFSPDGKKIVSGSGDKTVRVWDAITGQAALPPLQGHDDQVVSVAFSPTGRQIVSGSSDKTVRVWNAVTGQAALPPLQGHEDQVLSVAFSPDGKNIVSGSGDKTVRVWDAVTGHAALSPLQGHEGPVWSVAYSPDGKNIVSGSSDKTVRVWGAVTGQAALPPLQGNEASVESVAYSPDGSKIVSGSKDNTVRVWDAVTGQAALPPLEGHEQSVWSVAFSPDGRKIVSGSSDKTVRVWDAATGAELAVW